MQEAVVDEKVNDWVDKLGEVNVARTSLIAAAKVSNPVAADLADAKMIANEKADEANTAGDKAAAAVDELSVLNLARTVGFWALATIVGMAGAAVLQLYFLRTVCISNGPLWAEFLATRLIISGGSKPSHESIGRLQKPEPKDETR